MKKAIKIILMCLCIVIPCVIQSALYIFSNIEFGAIAVIIVYGPFLALFFAIKQGKITKAERKRIRAISGEKSVDVPQGVLSGGIENSVDLLAHIMEEQQQENLKKSITTSTCVGKQRFKIPMIILAVLSGVLSVALIIICVSWWNQNQADSSNIKALREDRDEMREENNFYRRYACIVTESGEKYHRYRCPYLSDMTSFWIYNTEAAEGRGYEPCSNCYDHTFQDIYDQLEDILEAAREEDKTG